MHPILYSFRRCPYAIRARCALVYAEITCEMREIALKDKPQAMLELSPKGTVPVLYLPDSQTVIDESLDIMHWALKKNPDQTWYPQDQSIQTKIDQLIKTNDFEFKPFLDRYKYPDRYLEQNQMFYFEKACEIIHPLEMGLAKSAYLLGDTSSLADIAIFPFIRQFAFVDKPRFDSQFKTLSNWLEKWLNSPLFETVMKKYSLWDPKQNTQKTFFPNNP